MNVTAEFEYLIIGAGPAGLQLGYFLEKANRNYIILESGESPGTFFKNFPRHKKLISINKVYTGYDDTEINLRWDWNSLLSDSEEMLFKYYSKEYFPNTDDLVKYLNDFANHFSIKIKFNCQAVRIAKDNNKFMIIDNSGSVYLAKYLIIATGFTKPYIPAISGIELTEKYTNISIDPNQFINQRVLIIGKGNSGFETADSLIGAAAVIHIVSRNPILMAWKTKYVGNLRAVNNNFLDTYQLKSQNGILDATVTKIEEHGSKLLVTFQYTHANGEEEKIFYDRVILCAGFRFDNSMFDESIKPEMAIDNRFPKQTNEWESTNIKNLYFAGVLMHMRDFKKKQSGFIHGFRYNIQALHKILEHKYFSQELPSESIAANADILTETIIKRVNKSSGLWQQTGFLCDLIVILEKGSNARYYQELPKDYIHDSEFSKCDNYYTVSLEFGYEVEKIADPFAIERIDKDDTDNARNSAFIHPIIRHFCRNTLIAEHHIIEDLASEWLEDVHIKPLHRFLKNYLRTETSLPAISELSL